MVYLIGILAATIGFIVGRLSKGKDEMKGIGSKIVRDKSGALMAMTIFFNEKYMEEDMAEEKKKEVGGQGDGEN